MYVEFITTTSARLDSIPIIDGQIIAVEDLNGYYYDMKGQRHPASGQVVIDDFPDVGDPNLLYVKIIGQSFKTYVYDEDTQEFIEACSGVIITEITQDDYNVLPEEEKRAGVYLITDGGEEPEYIHAANVIYNYTPRTWILSRNVQGAIDEIADRIHNRTVYTIRGIAESQPKIGDVIMTPADLGLGQVDNTPDSTKSVHHARFADSVEWVNIQNKPGIVELDGYGKIPSSMLPSYVDDVLEFPSRSMFPAVGEGGKIYVAADSNTTYRWSGSDYVAIGSSLALGETSTTAYRGDRGRIAYDHSQTPHNYLPLTGGTLTGPLTVNDSITATGSITGNKVYNPVWNDYAEYFERGEYTEPGDIIALDESANEEVYIKAVAGDKAIVGVHSDTFGHVLGGKPNMSEDELLQDYIPVGLAGRVFVKVEKTVRPKKGDYIGPSKQAGIGTVVKDRLSAVGVVVDDTIRNNRVKIRIL